MNYTVISIALLCAATLHAMEKMEPPKATYVGEKLVGFLSEEEAKKMKDFLKQKNKSLDTLRRIAKEKSIVSVELVLQEVPHDRASKETELSNVSRSTELFPEK